MITPMVSASALECETVLLPSEYPMKLLDREVLLHSAVQYSLISTTNASFIVFLCFPSFCKLWDEISFNGGGLQHPVLRFSLIILIISLVKHQVPWLIKSSRFEIRIQSQVFEFEFSNSVWCVPIYAVNKFQNLLESN
jgi:hypothetical protein